MFITVMVLSAPFALADGDSLLRDLEKSKRPGFVFDYAGVIRPDDKDGITQLLSELEDKTGAEVKIVTLASLQGGEIQDFSNRLFERWGIGKKGKDNGVLLLAAIQNRKVRIEVGYGLEGVIPDAAAGRILSQYVIPAFRQNDYSSGLRAGSEVIASAVARDAGVQLSGGYRMPRVETGNKRRNIVSLILTVLFVILLIRHPFLGLFLLTGMARGGGFSGGGFGGGGLGGFGGGLSGGGGAGRGW